jgi:N-acetyl-anhydromuramyl-L-alanine amidase AmpD
LIPAKLSSEELEEYQGILGHYHVQLNKQDPGPAFQWDHVVEGARRLMRARRALDAEKPATRMLDFK